MLRATMQVVEWQQGEANQTSRHKWEKMDDRLRQEPSVQFRLGEVRDPTTWMFTLSRRGIA